MTKFVKKKQKKNKKKQKTRAQLEYLTSDRGWTASVLNGLKNDPSHKFIPDVTLKAI
jgi:hypothetical protein